MLAVVIVCLVCGINYCTLQALNCFNVRSHAPPQTAFHSEYRSSEPCVWVPFFRWASFAQKLQKCSLGHPDMDTDMDTDRGAYREGAKVGQEGGGAYKKLTGILVTFSCSASLKLSKNKKKNRVGFKRAKTVKTVIPSHSLSVCVPSCHCVHTVRMRDICIG